MICNICRLKFAEFEGWFYAVDRDNEFAKGTADYHLLQRLVVCRECAEQAIKDGRSKAKSLPKEF